MSLLTTLHLSAPPSKIVPIIDTEPQGVLQTMSDTRVGGLAGTPNLDKDATIERLQTLLQTQSNKATALDENLKGLKAKQSQMIEANAQLLAESAKLKEQALAEDALSAENKSLKDTLVARDASLAALQKDLDAALQKSQDAAANLGDNVTIASNLEAAKAQLAAQTLQLKQAQDDLALQAANLKQTQDKLVAQTASLDQANAQRAATAADLEKLKSAHEQSRADQQSTLSYQNQALQEENAAFHQQLTNAHETIAAFQLDQNRAQLAAHDLAQQQWEEVNNALSAELSKPIQAFEQTKIALEKTKLTLAQKLAGQRGFVERLLALTKEKTALQMKLKELEDVDSKMAALTKAKVEAEASLAAMTAESADKTTNLDNLQSKLILAEQTKAQLTADYEKLQTSDIAPARQMKAQLLTYQRLVESNLNKLMQQLNLAARALNSLSQRVTQSRELSNKTDQLGRDISALNKDLKEYLQQLTDVLKEAISKPSGDSIKDQLLINQLTEQIHTATRDYDSLVSSANAQIAALQAQLRGPRIGGIDDSSELQKLQAKFDAQQTRADQERAIDQKLKDAELTAKIDALNKDLTRSAIGAQANRATDISVADAKVASAYNAAQQANISAQQANTSAAIANANAISAGFSRQAQGTAASSPMSIIVGQQPFGQQPFSQFASGMPQGQIPMTPQMMGSFPIQGQQMMTSLMGMPQYGAPTSMQSAQSTLTLIVQNNAKYRQQYAQAIQMILQPTISVPTRNGIEKALQQAIKSEAYYLYQYGQNGSAQTKQQAIQLIQSLIEETQKPLLELEQRLSSQGMGLIPPPTETVSLLQGYLTNLSQSAPRY